MVGLRHIYIEIQASQIVRDRHAGTAIDIPIITTSPLCLCHDLGRSIPKTNILYRIVSYYIPTHVVGQHTSERCRRHRPERDRRDAGVERSASVPRTDHRRREGTGPSDR